MKYGRQYIQVPCSWMEEGINKGQRRWTSSFLSRGFRKATMQSRWCDHSPRARYPGMWNQVGLRKHHYEQSWWKWWNSSWAISNPERWCCESIALNMPAILENSAVAIELERLIIIPIPKKGQRMFKLPHNCTQFTCYLSNAQNSPS